MSNPLQPHGLQHAKLPCPSLSPEVCSNSCPLSRWCHPTISSSVTLFSCPQSFPASGSFPVSWPLRMRRPRYCSFCFSISPSSEYSGLISLRTTGLIAVKVKVAQSCPTLCDPMDYTVHGILQARILEWVAFPFSKGSSQSRSPVFQADSLPAEPPEKSKNTGVGSLSILQQIFPTQESKQGFLHCRQILYQLSHQGSQY